MWITLIYSGFASLWIFASDRFVFNFLADAQNILWINIAKGVFFVAVTSILLWFLMRRMLIGLERSQAELADREDQIRTIYNAVNDGILIAHPESGIIHNANQTAGEIFRYDRSVFPACSLADLLSAADEGQAFKVDAGQGAHACLCKRADGSEFWAEVVCLKTRLGGEESLLVTIRDITDRHQAEQEILESRSRLRALLGHLEKAREEERTRISREVHDVLGQLLTGVKMNLKWITQRIPESANAREPLLAKLHETDTFANAILASIQEIAHDLRPGILDRLGLVPALRFEADRFAKRTGISCQFNTLIDEIQLPPENTTHVFRVVQEMLTNVARHASANMVTINLVRRGDETYVITVADNGIGIAEGKLTDPSSLGLLGMMERAKLLGGEVAIHPGARQGTTATLTFKESQE